MDNNKAFVCFLKNIKPIPNADKIVQADVVLNGITLTQVVTGKDTIENTMIVYFDSNMCLSLQVLKDYPDLSTYLAKNGRIRVIKLKGVISNGLAIEVDKFYRYFKDGNTANLSLYEGYSFTHLGDTEICHKYIPPVQGSGQTNKKKGRQGNTFNRIIPGQWHFHIDTEHLLRNAHKVHPDHVISISRKIHGASAIASNCLTKRQLPIIDRIARAIGIKVQETEYAYLYGSRTVIKNRNSNRHFYGTDVWTRVGEDQFKGKLHQGETVYYEIVGYIPGTQSMIQKNYTYGCNEGEYKIAIYRITLTSPDGHVAEYQWQAMKDRCVELGLPTVEEYYFGKANDLFKLDESNHWHENFINGLKGSFLEKKASDCKGSPPDEGIVLRIDVPGIEVFKLKSESFLAHESKSNEEGIVDIEEQQEQQEQ